MAENKVIVHIYGEEYPITGVTDPAHISKVADLVDARMKELARQSKVKSRDKVAILAALSIASELLEKTTELNGATDSIESDLDTVLARLESVLPADWQPKPA